MPTPRWALPPAVLLLSILVVGACVESESALPPVDAASGALVADGSADRLTTVRQLDDRFVIASDGPAVEVTILVDGVALDRRVGVRASIDGAAWADVLARRERTRNAATDVWVVTLPRPIDRVEYAVWAEPTAGGARLWDSADGRNFVSRADAPVRLAGERLLEDRLELDLDVANLAYEKECAALWTSDGWMNARYAIDSQYIGPSGPGRETWRVVMSTGFDAGPTAAQAATIEYVLTCRFAGGDPVWDNNHGRNYRAERATPAVEVWRQPFGSLIQLVAADDGTVFALATNDPPGGQSPGSRRFLTIYGPDGALRGAPALPTDVERLTWLPRAGLLLARVWSDAGARWVAVSTAGNLVWDATLDAATLVQGGERELLVGPSGFARLGADPPVFRPVVGGCPGAAMASATRLVCQQATRNAAFDATTGRLVRTYPAGALWAVGEDGTVILGKERPMASLVYGTLVAYDPTGALAYEKHDLWLPTGELGAVRVAGRCDNHAVGEFAALTTRPPTTELGVYAVEVFDVRTGAQVVRLEPGGELLQACPEPDGRFYWNSSYMRYGRGFSRVSPDGRHEYIDLGYNGRIVALLPGGDVARVFSPYYQPGEPRERVIVRAADGRERFAVTRDRRGMFESALVMAGDRLVSWDGATLVAFDVPTMPAVFR